MSRVERGSYVSLPSFLLLLRYTLSSYHKDVKQQRWKIPNSYFSSSFFLHTCFSVDARWWVKWFRPVLFFLI